MNSLLGPLPLMPGEPTTALKPNIYEFTEESHRVSAFRELQQMRERQLFTDVILRVDNVEFYCHRNVLAATSSYFMSMFSSDLKEKTENHITIQDIKSESMNLILGYAYTSKVVITEQNVQSLLEAANLFQIIPVRDACAEFLEKQLDMHNCLGIHHFADRYSCQELCEKAWHFSLENFPEVCGHSEIQLLQKDEILEYLSCDELHIEKEDSVFETMIRWVQYDPKNRLKHLPELLEQLRINLLSSRYLLEVILRNEYVTTSEVFDKFMAVTKKYRSKKTNLITPPRMRARLQSNIVIVGGVGIGNSKVMEVYSYEPAQQTWSLLTKLPKHSDSVYSVTSLGNDIYVTGLQGKVSMYSIKRNKWFESAPMNQPRHRHASTSLDGYVYVVGGYDGASRLSSTERFDPKNNNWEQVKSLLEAVSSPGIVTCDGKIYVLGGVTSNDIATDKVQCYDPKTDNWTLVAPMPHCLACISVEVLRGCIYVVGCVSKIVHCYNPETDSWRQVECMNSQRASCAATVCNGKLYVTGGESQPNSPVDTMECYDPVTNVWTVLPTLPYSVKLQGCVTVSKKTTSLESSVATLLLPH
uniref:Kelch-like protein 24-like n=1 Tax=Saccoglossus kowalevskii TaxID=10224 RepID=A0ABM0LXD2_SACKO|nr:PREDICTED: kelch-like protein 24-like [Saccoglossus kowalevskii]